MYVLNCVDGNSVVGLLGYFGFDWGFGQVFCKDVLVYFCDDWVFQFVIFVQEGEVEGVVEIVEDFVVFCLGQYCMWVYYGGDIVIDESFVGKICDFDYVGDYVFVVIGCCNFFYFGQDDFVFGFEWQVVQC